MTDAQIERLALDHGFKRKTQASGAAALNTYVFEFARALLAAASTPIEPVAIVRVLDAQEGSYQSTIYWISDPMPDGTELYGGPLHAKGELAGDGSTPPAPPDDELKEATNDAMDYIECMVKCDPKRGVGKRIVDRLRAAIGK